MVIESVDVYLNMLMETWCVKADCEHIGVLSVAQKQCSAEGAKSQMPC